MKIYCMVRVLCCEAYSGDIERVEWGLIKGVV